MTVLVTVIMVVRQSGIRTRGRFDLTGALLLSAALTCFCCWWCRRSLREEHQCRGPAAGDQTAVTLAVWAPCFASSSANRSSSPAHLGPPTGAADQPGVEARRLRADGDVLVGAPAGTRSAVAGGYSLERGGAGLAMVPGGLATLVISPVSAGLMNVFGGRITS